MHLKYFAPQLQGHHLVDLTGPAATPSLPTPYARALAQTNCYPMQTMLMGEKKLIGRGYIRDVYLVEWEGRKLVVKFLREDYEAKASETRVEKIHRMEAAALDAVREKMK